MKQFKFLLVFLLSVILIAGCGKKSEDGTTDADENKKDDKKGIGVFQIKYDIKGETNMTLDMFAKEKDFKIKMTGVEENGKNIDALMFIKEGYMYMVAEEGGKKMGLKFKVDDKENEFKDIADLTNVKNKLKDAKKEGTEKVLDYECDIYKEGKNTMWVYKDMFILKMTDGKTTMEAKEFNPEATTDAAEFELPKDVEFQDMEKLMEGMKNLNP